MMICWQKLKTRVPSTEHWSVSAWRSFPPTREVVSILFDSLLGTLFSKTISLLQSDSGTLRRDLRRSHAARQMY